MLEQPIPYLVCRQKIYLENSVDWQLVRGDEKDLNWNGIFRFPCPALSQNAALLRVFRNISRKRMIVVRTGGGPWFDDWCVLAHRAKQRAYRLWSRSEIQADWE